ncbi:hypothetical protein CPB86DRAFT_877719 [Serendipita vermifera]|nr:hypothetical protein CPB86DRAFT_877719 [Serendipita vermifera]
MSLLGFPNKIRRKISHISSILGVILSPVLAKTAEVVLIMILFHLANPMLLYGWLPDIPSQLLHSNELESVSGLYGPGAYTAWVLCTISAIFDSRYAEGSSPKFSPDQLASFLYSTVSTYWYYGRVLRFNIRPGAIVQDCSAQAASVVFNVSVLLHGLGVSFSTEEKGGLWLAFAMWDIWLWAFSPMTYSDILSMCIHMGFTPLPELILVQIAHEDRPDPWKFAPFFFIPFILLETTRTRYFNSPLLIVPKSSSVLQTWISLYP